MGGPEVGLPGSRPRREVESRFSRALSPGGSHVLPPRHSQMAARGAGPKQTKDPWPEEQGGGRHGGQAPARVAQSPGPRPPRRSRQRRGKGRAPRATVPVPGRLERLEKPCPTTRWDVGGQAASTPSPAAPRFRQRSNEKQAPDSRPLRPRPPSPVRPALLLTIGAFEGIFRPLKIGRHFGGRVGSHGVSELLAARGGRGDEGEPARGPTRLASSGPRPASQRWKGGSHVTSARRRRRRRQGPG